MAAYIPGAGIKKALNQISGPIYPDIKQGPPRFVWSRKHWDVDVGATMRDTEPITQFYESAVLAQSRDYNSQTAYGKSSHKDIVNANFRPPLIDQYEDLGPLTRIPATTRAIIPHINPSTVSDGGTSGYIAKNERASDIEGALSDRVSGGQWRPTFFAPIEVPMDNSILPDLEAKLPSVSVFSGCKFPVNVGYDATQGMSWADVQSITMGDKPSPLIDAGYTTKVRLDGESGFENFTLGDNRPRVSASAGMNTPVRLDMDTPIPILDDNRPHVSASAGMNTPVRLDMDTPIPILNDNRPMVSADAGISTPVRLDMESPYETMELSTKIEQTPVMVLNPGSENGYHERQNMYSRPDDYIQDKRPSYSYVIPGEEPIYREKNEMTYRPHFHEKLQASKSYGQLSQSGGAIPRSGMNIPSFALPLLGQNEGFAGVSKTAKYRF